MTAEDMVRIDRAEALGRAVSALINTENVPMPTDKVMAHAALAQAWVAIAHAFREGESWTAPVAQVELSRAAAAAGRPL